MTIYRLRPALALFLESLFIPKAYQHESVSVYFEHNAPGVSGSKRQKAKNDNNDNTEPNGMKSESGKLWVYRRFYVARF